MVSKRWSKLVKSLQIKKYRNENQLFFIEGAKSILEVIRSNRFFIEKLFVTEAFYTELVDNEIQLPDIEIVTTKDLNQLGTLKSNKTGLAVVKMPKKLPTFNPDSYTVVLDNLQDPGNLGTIIRICDWYCISNIICSFNTVDLYNYKVIQASMGSFTRVQVYYCDLPEILYKYTSTTTYGMFLEGESVHNIDFEQDNGFIVLGNEANGISVEVNNFIDRKVTIPKYGAAESLNVGIATAIVLDNLKRKQTGNSL